MKKNVTDTVKDLIAFFRSKTLDVSQSWAFLANSIEMGLWDVGKNVQANIFQILPVHDLEQ